MLTESKAQRQTEAVKEVKTDSSGTVKATESRHDRTGSETFTEQADGEEVVTTIREYDTSLPADTTTGTPPLRREITQTRRKASTARQVQATDQTTDQHRDTDAQAQQQRTDTRTEQTRSQHQETTAVQADETEKRGLSVMLRLLCLGGVFGIVAALLWGCRKLKRYL